jgi:hypothetical protein
MAHHFRRAHVPAMAMEPKPLNMPRAHDIWRLRRNGDEYITCCVSKVYRGKDPTTGANTILVEVEHSPGATVYLRTLEAFLRLYRFDAETTLSVSLAAHLDKLTPEILKLVPDTELDEEHSRGDVADLRNLIVKHWTRTKELLRGAG